MGAVSTSAPKVGRRGGGGGRGPSSAAREERRLAAYMVAPSILVIAIVAAYPIGYAIWLSLHEYSIRVAGLSRWAGLNNYIDAFQSAEWWSAVSFTFILTVISVTIELLVGLAMALAMHEAFKGRALLRTVVLVPYATLTVVTAIMWQTIFEPQLGFVNTMLGAIGLPDDTVWLGDRWTALGVFVLAEVWKTAPFMALLLLAGLQVISSDLYEAAKIDGASTWQRFTRITLPLLRPAILVALLFRTLDALRIFDLPFVLTRGQNETSTMSLEAYTQLQQNRLIGEGSALSVLTFLIVMIVSFTYIRFVGGNLKQLAED
jgi:multiple sugar transport system permease protein